MPGRRKAKSNVEQVTEQRQDRGVYFTDSETPWGGFVNIRLDEQQKQAFFTWLEGASGAIHQLIDDILSQQAKVSLAYDTKNQCYIVSVTGALMLDLPDRFVSTSRAASLHEALGLTAWKHFYLCDGDYGNYKPSDGSFMSWG